MTLARRETLGGGEFCQGGVLLLHGFGRTGRSMGMLGSRLREVGLSTWAPTYRSFRASIPEIVDQLVPGIVTFQKGFDGPLHLVTHSLGGLVARALLARERPDPLGRVVMLAPPNAGSEWADLLFRMRLSGVVLGPVGSQLRAVRSRNDEAVLGVVDYDLGVIAGDRALDPIFPRLLIPRPNDGKVSVEATRIAGMSDHIVLPVSHTLMVNSRRVADEVLAYLEYGRFRDP